MPRFRQRPVVRRAGVVAVGVEQGWPPGFRNSPRFREDVVLERSW